jgi:hypothetical protein
MNSTVIRLIISGVLLAVTLAALPSCAGGSRGTGVRYNRSLDVSPFELPDEEQDKKKSKRRK